MPHSAFKVGRYVAVSRPGAPADLSLACDGSLTTDSITLCGSVFPHLPVRLIERGHGVLLARDDSQPADDDRDA
jgi:hypothetical protein